MEPIRRQWLSSVSWACERCSHKPSLSDTNESKLIMELCSEPVWGFFRTYDWHFYSFSLKLNCIKWMTFSTKYTFWTEHFFFFSLFRFRNVEFSFSLQNEGKLECFWTPKKVKWILPFSLVFVDSQAVCKWVKIWKTIQNIRRNIKPSPCSITTNFNCFFFSVRLFVWMNKITVCCSIFERFFFFKSSRQSLFFLLNESNFWKLRGLNVTFQGSNLGYCRRNARSTCFVINGNKERGK